jgi:hypothetical protein
MSISMNMWIPERDEDIETTLTKVEAGEVAKDDRWDSLTESLCTFLFGSILDSVRQSDQSIPLGVTAGWYSPSEMSQETDPNGLPLDTLDHQQNFNYILTTLSELVHEQDDENLTEQQIIDEERFSPEMKKKIAQILLSTILQPKIVQEAAIKILREVKSHPQSKL